MVPSAAVISAWVEISLGASPASLRSYRAIDHRLYFARNLQRLGKPSVMSRKGVMPSGDSRTISILRYPFNNEGSNNPNLLSVDPSYSG